MTGRVCGPRGVAPTLLAVLLGLTVTGSAMAQEATLDRVASLSAEGRTAEARDVLLEWWESRRDDASDAERQRGLWLRGTLTVDPSIARRDYTRLVLEHPGGPHSADALLRLAQAASVGDRLVAADRLYEQLLREYPNSPHRLEARRWLAENRHRVARARAEADPSSEDGRESGPDPGPDPGVGTVTVQLGAFSSAGRARTLLERARAEGIEGLRLVRVVGSDLVRVRAGRYATREAASALLSRLEERGFEAAIVTDADRESAIP